jgi:hypothetical protein
VGSNPTPSATSVWHVLIFAPCRLYPHGSRGFCFDNPPSGGHLTKRLETSQSRRDARSGNTRAIPAARSMQGGAARLEWEER